MPSSLDVNNARFNAEAAEWDNNVKHVESTQKALDAIRRHIPAFADGTAKDLDVLEIDCGTGLLSFLLAPQVRTLIGVDTASGMLSGFDAKLAALPDRGTANLTSVNVLLRDPDDAALQKAAAELDSRVTGSSASPRPRRFDLIVSHLTLHHIPSMPDMFATLAACLKPGGRVALTDYEDYGDEAIAFHPVAKREGVERHGIRRAEVVEAMREAGLVDVGVEEAFVLRKEVEAEAENPARAMDFPFLIMLGRKKE
ncbi:hypothetical protein PpBr36_06852 [Pyricularia pennisetigena]|uniref:hypothetical protein n=1 Tax=Pyricularia pennisetigena TaxID=1578925 RepID=UPI00114F303A|nr:hypothetical protein PpBr36_06852 [Pyricularia pennisetigena]TLS25454.1 hypothetical protein PpBr36_06852 [Pyricularia pennisetigena]